ncbi:hypothetical protein [Cryobacterium sp. SO1]|uniref:hypothetical protein n=1 Tax=Cryobacterium sp. SO1 TaxID=1897061 RepID=UPI001023BCB3|nr:hypothetical protein [Cryobacterium sp. SO1]
MTFDTVFADASAGVAAAAAIFVAANFRPTVRWTRRLNADSAIASQLPSGAEKTEFEASALRQAQRLVKYRAKMTGTNFAVSSVALGVSVIWLIFVAVLLVLIIGDEGSLFNLIRGVEVWFYLGLIVSLAYIVWQSSGLITGRLSKMDIQTPVSEDSQPSSWWFPRCRPRHVPRTVNVRVRNTA